MLSKDSNYKVDKSNIAFLEKYEEKTNLLEQVNQIIKDKKSKVSGKDISIHDVQDSLKQLYSESYSEDALNKYKNAVDELTKKKEKSGLKTKEATKLRSQKQLLHEQEYIKEMLDILNKESISKDEALKVLLPFADPTLDVSFKMLFGQNENKDILISLLNSLLDFKGKNLITEVAINPSELVVSNISYKKGETGISSTVDILCTTDGGKQIAIEMQGQKTNYFLTREQEYMAKLIYGQVKDGQGNEYHEKVLDTYILVIGKNNMFVGNTALKGKLLNSNISAQNLFEIDVEPRVKQTGEIVPGNKMHWKFFELPKFKASSEFSKINNLSDIKYQWLEFLIECNSQTEIPDRNELIQKGYNIMKLATWDSSDRAKLWKQKQNEIDALQQKVFDKEDAYQKGKLEERLTSDIDKIKMGNEFNLQKESIFKKFKCLNKKRFAEKDWSEEQVTKINKKPKIDTSDTSKLLDIFDYVGNNLHNDSKKICGDLNLVKDFEDISYNSDITEMSNL